MRNKVQFILNLFVILFFLSMEYSWFENLPAMYVRFSVIMFLVLVGLKVFLEREKIRYFINSLSEKITTFVGNNKPYTAFFIGILLLAIVIRLPAAVHVEGAMDADEAVEGIMAIHIYKGMHRPITMYKHPLNYTLKSHLAALFFNITGISAKTLQAVDLLFCICILIFMYFLALEIFGRETALITLFLLAIPASHFYYTCLLRVGDYPELLFFGIVVLFLTHRYVARPRIINRDIPKWIFSLIGFLFGVGFSTQPLMIVFIISSLIVLFLKDIKHFLKHILWRLVVFFFVGYFPFIIHNIRTNYSALKFLMHPPKAPLPMSIIERIKMVAHNIALAFGNVSVPSLAGGPSMEIEGRLQLIIVIVLLALCATSILYFLCKKGLRLKHWVLILPIILTICVNFRPARSGPNARYMIPLFASMPIFLAWWLSTFRGKLKYLILLLIFINNMTYISHYLLYFREREIERTELISKLNEMEIKYVGTGYWQAYPITFITEERIICTGRYGVSSRSARKGDPVTFDRYDPYHEKFREALRDNPRSCAFVFEGSSDYEKNFINSLGIPLDRMTVGRYKIYTLQGGT